MDLLSKYLGAYLGPDISLVFYLHSVMNNSFLAIASED